MPDKGRIISIFFLVILVFLGWVSLLSSASTDKNPHPLSNKGFEAKCRDCHSADPRKIEKWEDSLDVKNLPSACQSCHTVPENCRLISSKKASQILTAQLQYIGLPLFSDQISCGSCHIFHWSDTSSAVAGGKGLNGFYPNFWYRAQQIDPHKSGVFCQLCHEVSIGLSTENLKLKLNGDRIEICIQCHNGKKARADNHPIRIAPSKDKGVTIPDGYPLLDGKLTCITCHKMPCQGGNIENKLLRGGPFEKRVDACLVCHSKERYQAINPHIQIDENGKIMKNKCLYCHII